MGLETYQRKRDFGKTPEPKGRVERKDRHRFVVQEHHASRLHYDFRLEMDGVLKSWAVPRGPSMDPREKRLAVQVEDHPVSYIDFEGEIAEGNYGAGRVYIWDKGTYELTSGEPPLEQLKKGSLTFRLHGEKLKGEFHLVRMGGRGASGDSKDGTNWLLIKARDQYASRNGDPKPVAGSKVGDSAVRRPSRSGSKTTKSGSSRSPKRPSLRKVKVEGEGVPAAEALSAKSLAGDMNVEVDGHLVKLSGLDKVYFPESGFTKGDLVKYYWIVAEYLLPYLKDRPLILKRYPNGIQGQFFFQHNVEQVPDYVDTFTTQALGHTVNYAVCNNAATLLYLANLGVIPLHPWHSRVKSIDHPDWIVFDLDPGEVEFRVVCQAALVVKKILNRLGLECFPKTSGSRGLHVYVPIQPRYTYEEVARFAEGVAKQVVKEDPQVTTVVRALDRRGQNRIYVDHLQNARGKTIVAPYSVRERPGATVSAPLTWDEVADKITPQDFDIKTMPRRLQKKGDPFQPLLQKRQRLESAQKKLEELYETTAP